jgi:hypothetical protein
VSETLGILADDSSRRARRPRGTPAGRHRCHATAPRVANSRPPRPIPQRARPLGCAAAWSSWAVAAALLLVGTASNANGEEAEPSGVVTVPSAPDLQTCAAVRDADAPGGGYREVSISSRGPVSRTLKSSHLDAA